MGRANEASGTGTTKHSTSCTDEGLYVGFGSGNERRETNSVLQILGHGDSFVVNDKDAPSRSVSRSAPIIGRPLAS